MRGQTDCPWCHGEGLYEFVGDAHRSPGVVPCNHTPPYYRWHRPPEVVMPTREGVRSIQTLVGVTADGIVGPQTLEAVKNLVSGPRDLWLAELRKQTALMEEMSATSRLVLDTLRASNSLLIKIKSLTENRR